MKYKKLILAVFFVGLFQISLYAKQESESSKKLQLSNKVIVLEETIIKTINAETIEVKRTKNGLVFKGYEDKIILLEMFGHSCPPCKAAIPAYKRLQKKYKKDIVVIAVEVWGTNNKELKKYASTYGLDYKAVAKVNSGNIISFVKKLTGWSPNNGVPYLMLLSRGGNIAKDVPPQIFPEAYVESLIKELLLEA